MNFDDALALRAFTMLAQNGALVFDDFAKMNGIEANEAEGLLIALSAALSDEAISTDLGHADSSDMLFTWNPRPDGMHGRGPKTRLSPDEDAALRDALADFGMDACDPLWVKLFEAKGVCPDGAGAAATRAGVNPSAATDAATAAGGPSSARGRIVSALSALASTIDLEEHRLVSFAYCPAGAQESSVRRVAPVRIVSDGDVSLLQAWKPMEEDAAAAVSPAAPAPSFEFRSYRIDRMTDLRVLDERFDPGALPQEGAQGKPRKVRLRFLGDGPLPEWPGLKLASGRAKKKGGSAGGTAQSGGAAQSSGAEQGGSAKQPGDAGQAGGVEARIPWYGSDWLPQRIAALGGSCIPLDDDLRQRVLAYIARLR